MDADITDLTAEQILAVPRDEPERLFRTADDLRPTYHALARTWHGDSGGSEAVFAHISLLHAEARRRLARGTWRAPGLVKIRGTDGVLRLIRYRKIQDVEIGRAYIARTHVTWVVAAAHADLFEAGTRAIDSVRFADAAMRIEFERCLPIRTRRFTAEDGSRVLVVGKAPDVVMLGDLVRHLGGRLPHRHAAWILSGLYNIACWLDWARLTHNAIAPDTVFVSAESHDVLLLGGWWYAAAAGRRLRALPTRTATTIPASVMRDRTADPRADLALIRLTGREILGDPAGARLGRSDDTPRPLADWLRAGAAAGAVQTYGFWQDILTESYGRRRFTDLPVAFDDVYPPP